MAPEARNRNLDVFANGRKEGRVDVDHVLICTDRAARGVDFDAAPVDHIVIFDFPKDPAEYIRRVGRTARAGRQGTSTVFAYGWQLPVARKVMGSKVELVSGESIKDDENDYEIRNQKPNRKKKNTIQSIIERGELWSS